MIDAAIQDLARKVLSDKQFEAWELELAGYTSRRMMWLLGVPRSTILSRLEAAHLNLLNAGIRIDPATGRYYLEEPAA